ncbi:MAG: protein translocase subunit SecDF [Cytophagales bacterium]|nr:protein translocase subunit SecDF [Cytophagales bacterium]
MRNKGLIVSLTVVITLLCVYYLSFTWVAKTVNDRAAQYAIENKGSKQQYLDSVWREPVFNFFGAKYTLQEVKETELNLGLDLQGGMHVTLEVSPVAIIEAMAGNTDDADFKAAIQQAVEEQKSSQKPFTTLFFQAFKRTAPKKKLATIFAISQNQGKISSGSTDTEVKRVIRGEVGDAVDRAFEILRTRIDRFGTSQPNIQKLENTGRIQIELPGVDNPERVRKLLQGVAKLEFYEVATPDQYVEALYAVNKKLVDEQELAEKEELVTKEGKEVEEEEGLSTLTEGASDTAAAEAADSAAVAPKISPLFELLVGRNPSRLVYLVQDTGKINRILKRPEVQHLLPRGIKFLWQVKPDKLDDGAEIVQLYAIKEGRRSKALLSGEVVSNARQDLDEYGKVVVNMQMNAVGAKKWKKITRNSIGKQIAIVLDNYVYTAPVVNGEIPNGSSQISGNFTIDEAKDLANILKSGSLPAPTRIVEEAVIGPTLGKEAQQQGLNSIFVGLAVVVIFMVLYYSRGGFVANLALVFNIFFILGILANLQAALTLPGIAGIVLTIGMSIDANVLIFERIREERRIGASLMHAISKGYDKAFSSIFDANVTSFLVAAILYVLGQGPVKGFAITLMIGIASSFFTAVFITRVIMTWMTKKGDESKMSFEMGWSKSVLSSMKANFMSKRKVAYGFSAVFIAVGLALTIANGLNFGVDFKGGRSYVVRFSEAVPASDLKVGLLPSFGNKGTEVKTFGSDKVLKVTTSYLVEDESDKADAKVKNALVTGLEKLTGEKYEPNDNKNTPNSFSIVSSSKVGATIADDIKNSSVEAGLLALLVLFFYILVRFRKWQFSLGAIAALFHDVMFVISAFAIARLFGFDFEVDQVFVAAILTIVGYSINDTVVVFDRIREEIGLHPKMETAELFNQAINSTISRTLITSFTTFVVVLILLLFGGEVLRGFSFAMIVGIVIGTYSSIFIATPIVLDLAKNKEKAQK